MRKGFEPLVASLHIPVWTMHRRGRGPLTMQYVFPFSSTLCIPVQQNHQKIAPAFFTTHIRTGQIHLSICKFGPYPRLQSEAYCNTENKSFRVVTFLFHSLCLSGLVHQDSGAGERPFSDRGHTKIYFQSRSSSSVTSILLNLLSSKLRNSDLVIL